MKNKQTNYWYEDDHSYSMKGIIQHRFLFRFSLRSFFVGPTKLRINEGCVTFSKHLFRGIHLHENLIHAINYNVSWFFTVKICKENILDKSSVLCAAPFVRLNKHLQYINFPDQHVRENCIKGIRIMISKQVYHILMNSCISVWIRLY